MNEGENPAASPDATATSKTTGNFIFCNFIKICFYVHTLTVGCSFIEGKLDQYGVVLQFPVGLAIVASKGIR